MHIIILYVFKDCICTYVCSNYMYIIVYTVAYVTRQMLKYVGASLRILNLTTGVRILRMRISWLTVCNHMNRDGGMKGSFLMVACCSVKPRILLNIDLSASLASKWEKPVSDVLAFVRSRLLFASVHSASMCLRGSRVKWRSGLGFDYGAPLQFVMQ